MDPEAAIPGIADQWHIQDVGKFCRAAGEMRGFNRHTHCLSDPGSEPERQQKQQSKTHTGFFLPADAGRESGRGNKWHVGLTPCQILQAGGASRESVLPTSCVTAASGPVGGSAVVAAILLLTASAFSGTDSLLTPPAYKSW